MGRYRADWPSNRGKRTYSLGVDMVDTIERRAQIFYHGNATTAAREILEAGCKALNIPIHKSEENTHEKN